jgi:hypothetical protein
MTNYSGRHAANVAQGQGCSLETQKAPAKFAFQISLQSAIIVYDLSGVLLLQAALQGPYDLTK